MDDASVLDDVSTCVAVFAIGDNYNSFYIVDKNFYDKKRYVYDEHLSGKVVDILEQHGYIQVAEAMFEHKETTDKIRRKKDSIIRDLLDMGFQRSNILE
jgi:hypothetical protein